jgi:hypothetical protein
MDPRDDRARPAVGAAVARPDPGGIALRNG